MKINTKIGLGDTVEDKFTGFRGIVQAISLLETGCTHVSVQPAKLNEAGATEDWVEFLESDLKIVKPAQTRIRLMVIGIKMGDIVSDTDTPLKGKVQKIAWYRTGCVSVLVQPKKLTKSGLMGNRDWIDTARLKVTKKATKKVIKPKGGPGNSVQRGRRA